MNDDYSSNNFKRLLNYTYNPDGLHSNFAAKLSPNLMVSCNPLHCFLMFIGTASIPWNAPIRPQLRLANTCPLLEVADTPWSPNSIGFYIHSEKCISPCRDNNNKMLKTVGEKKNSATKVTFFGLSFCSCWACKKFKIAIETDVCSGATSSSIKS